MDIDVDFTDELISHLSEVGFDSVYGARPLRRAIQSKVEDLISDEMLSDNIKEGDHILIDYQNDKIVVNHKGV